MPAEALLAYMAALAIQQKLVEDNPTVSQFQGDLAGSHLSIGNMLIDTGKPAEALRSYESALMLQRKLVEANPAVLQFQSDVAASHNNIGLLLRSIGKAAEALRAYESALAIRQRLSQEHPDIIDLMSDLGQTLSNLGMIDLDAKRFEAARVRLRQAIECQRKALGLNPANSTYRQLLDNHLVCLIQAERGLNNSGSVIKAEHELAELRDSDPMMVALDARLSTILLGDQKPGDNSERLKLARRAYDKSIHALAATLWADALDTDTKLAGDRQIQVRYNAACAAALAGCGQGQDAPAPDEAARARLREQARGWLVAELAVWANLVESGPAQARPFVVHTLQHWQGDSDLAGVREAKALEALPEVERKPWVDLWAEVAALLARASKP
jgi:tetratricopeptide (TPR) repeat protein